MYFCETEWLQDWVGEKTLVNMPLSQSSVFLSIWELVSLAIVYMGMYPLEQQVKRIFTHLKYG